LIAIHFRYVGDSRAETIQFYRFFIRGFLRWYRTEAVWVKGAKIRRKAYFVFSERLVERAKQMFKDELRHGGYFEAEHASAIDVIREALDLMRDTHGYLRYDSAELGDPDENWCPLEGYRLVSVRDYCIGKQVRDRNFAPTGAGTVAFIPNGGGKRGKDGEGLMKYTITYSRKVRTRAYESLEVGLHAEFDETLSWNEAFN